MFEFWRRYKLERHALSDADWRRASAPLRVLRGLSVAEQQRLRELATLFLANKTISPSDGFRLRQDQRIEIAIWACLPVLELGLRVYSGFRGVIVYPGEFLAPREDVDEAGVVHDGFEEVSGESWEAGPILLSWADIKAERTAQGANVVIHECAHKLDLLDGTMNGVPELSGSGVSGARWREIMTAAWLQISNEEQERGETSIDDYALESPAEFFAVLSEYFFTAPAHLRAVLPDAFGLLQRYYRVDPLPWNRRVERA